MNTQTKDLESLGEQVTALLAVEAAYIDALTLLRNHDRKRPTEDDHKGLSYANAVTDWRIGYETIANDILRRAGY